MILQIEEAYTEIEETLRQIDPIILYHSSVGRELQNILRRIRNEKRSELSTEINRL